jgi:DNA-binding NarL/FixJ family response regulator
MRPAPSEHGEILIVDDVPGNLAVLHDALDAQGYSVRVAIDGSRALESARRQPPDLILLDALMPGIDGYETCRRLKADLATRHIPVIFMTGLSDTEHVVQGFQAGGIDYVAKPIRPPEVLARIAAHLRNSRVVAETQQAADAAGDAIVAVDDEGCVQWATPLAQRWLHGQLDTGARLPLSVRRWLAQEAAAAPAECSIGGVFAADGTSQPALSFSRLASLQGRTRLLIRQRSHAPAPEALIRALKLTAREAEVLHWVALGKTNPEIAAVLEMSPRTVNKHLEHIFTKLGVETRTAAASVALNKGRAGVAPATA